MSVDRQSVVSVNCLTMGPSSLASWPGLKAKDMCGAALGAILYQDNCMSSKTQLATTPSGPTKIRNKERFHQEPSIDLDSST